jgi:membrane associated rhomboid family serine protease
MSITIIIIIITCIVSISAFRSQKVMNDLIFYPPAVVEGNQYYRFITCGLIHADLGHLFFNMYAFYLFGEGVEVYFSAVFGNMGRPLFIIMYVLALIVCLIPSFQRNRHNPEYRSLGASGAVSAVVFSYIVFNPLQGIGLIFIPIFIPGFLFGFFYLLVSYYLDKRGGGRINHSAHIWGALFGIAFTFITCHYFSTYPLLKHFTEAVRSVDLRHIFTTP